MLFITMHLTLVLMASSGWLRINWSAGHNWNYQAVLSVSDNPAAPRPEPSSSLLRRRFNNESQIHRIRSRNFGSGCHLFGKISSFSANFYSTLLLLTNCSIWKFVFTGSQWWTQGSQGWKHGQDTSDYEMHPGGNPQSERRHDDEFHVPGMCHRSWHGHKLPCSNWSTRQERLQAQHGESVPSFSSYVFHTE